MKELIEKLYNKINKQKAVRLLKVVFISTGIFVFLAALFVAGNETRKTIDAPAVTVGIIKEGVDISYKNSVYEIKFDNSKLESLKSFVADNKGGWPFIPQILGLTNELSKKIINLF